MRRLSLSLLLAIAATASSCGQASSWRAVSPVAEAGGVQIRVISTKIDDHTEPWRVAPAGRQCLVVQIEARSTDGATHELRPDQFAVDGKQPIDAVGYCNAGQIEPSWVSPPGPQLLTITVLTPFGSESRLMWRSP